MSATPARRPHRLGAECRAGSLAAAGPESPALSEPEGLGVDGSTLYAADMNHHRVVAIGLDTGAAAVAAG